MNLDALHKKLSRDETYRRAHEQTGERFELAMHCMTVCEERGISNRELADATRLPTGAIHSLENFREVDDEVFVRIVKFLEPWLRRRGVDTDHWMALGSPKPAEATERPAAPASRADAPNPGPHRRRSMELPTGRRPDADKNSRTSGPLHEPSSD